MTIYTCLNIFCSINFNIIENIFYFSPVNSLRVKSLFNFEVFTYSILKVRSNDLGYIIQTDTINRAIGVCQTCQTSLFYQLSQMLHSYNLKIVYRPFKIAANISGWELWCYGGIYKHSASTEDEHMLCWLTLFLLFKPIEIILA